MKYDCLKDVIGIKTDCETIDGSSGFYINQIPGIDVPSANGIKSSEYLTGVDLLKNTLNFACDIVGQDILKSLDGAYRFNSVLNENSYCFYENTFKGNYAGWRGVRVRRRYKNVYVAMRITSIRVQVEFDASVTVRITEANGAVKNVTADLIGKTPTDLILNYICLTDYVDIEIDNTAVSVVSSACSSGCASCNSLQPSRYDNYVEVFGLYDGTETNDEVFGILPAVQMACNDAKLLCSIKAYLDTCILYKFAGLFFIHEATSKRNNRYTTYTTEESMAKSVYYDNPVSEGLYQTELQKVRDSLRNYFGSVSDVCFECRDAKYGFVMP